MLSKIEQESPPNIPNQITLVNYSLPIKKNRKEGVIPKFYGY